MATDIESTRIAHIWHLVAKLTPLEKLSLSELLTADARKELQRAEQQVAIPNIEVQQPVSLSQYAGVGADLWQEIDVEEYIQQERDAWQK